MALTNLKVSQKQFEEAQAIVASYDEKKNKSLKASMVSFCKLHGDTEALNMKLNPREDIMLKYFCYQKQREGAKTSTATVLKETFHKETIRTHIPMNAFMIKKKYGEATFQHWKDSGKLGYEADTVTGSELEEHRMYLVPKKWVEDRDGHSGEKADKIEEDIHLT